MDELEWRDDTLPVSTRYDAPYYSRHDGRAETGHVFIQGNNLPARWPSMEDCILAELGFGTGLNFLETVRHWREIAPEGSRLHFISFEQYPMPPEAMRKALSAWSELDQLASKLVDVWTGDATPLTLDFSQNIQLTVHMGDANALLPNTRFEADAWYLDGFSPAKNHELWNEDLMCEVGRHTVADGTFVTYTAAGFVRRGLQAAGFEVRKTKGFGSKREMLCGHKQRDIHVADRH